MVKEIVQFTEVALADPDFRNIGLEPRDGLHIVLQVEKVGNAYKVGEQPIFSGVYSQKKKSIENEWFEKCAAWSQVAWMIAVNKCFDAPAKAVHSCSPFCYGLKKTNLEGGEQFLKRQKTNKDQYFERIDSYFSKTESLLDNADEIAIAQAFCKALNDRQRFQNWLNASDDFNKLNENDYIIFYLDLPRERYESAYQKYRKSSLFNTAEYNISVGEHLYGTSGWLNSFPTKKPFLLHQTATFDIAGRITVLEADVLDEFSELARRKLFPNPLPIFIYENERIETFKIIKEDILGGGVKRKHYFEVLRELWESLQHEIGNYYLLFWYSGEIRDFDFVSRFEYNLNADGSPWEVPDIFKAGQSFRLANVQDLMLQALPPMFNNALIVQGKKGKETVFHWFDEIDSKYTKSHNAYLMAMKYRKAFYDFIYKSQRQSVSARAIEDILMTGILDDIRLDRFDGKYNTENLNIRTKLNLLFGLHRYFSTQHNFRFMPDNIIELRARLQSVANGEAHLETDEQFAFAAGQVIDRIFYASKTADKSFGYLEPFLAQTDAIRFKLAIANFFKRYKHANFSQRFQNVSAEVLTYPKTGDIRDLLPIFLAGVFSENQLFSDKKQQDITDSATGTENS